MIQLFSAGKLYHCCDLEIFIFKMHVSKNKQKIIHDYL